MALTENEIKILSEKLNNLEKDVKCPRCGASLKYVEYPNGIKIYCENDTEIIGCLRGI